MVRAPPDRIPRTRPLVVTLCVSALLLGGCFRPSTKTQGAGGVPIDATAGIDPDVTPFILEVVDEGIEGDRLRIKGRIIPKNTRPAAGVVVRLSALDRAGKEKTSFHNMADLIPGGASTGSSGPLLEKNVAQPFTLSLPKEGVSSYQVEVLWGREAEPYPPLQKPKAPAAPEPTPIPAKEPPKQFIALQNMEVHRVPSESCATPDECLITFTITGELFNSGQSTIKEVVIVAGFAGSDKLDLQGQILENEKRVDVPNLRLPPGGMKRFKISLEKLVPPTLEVAPQPVVRIASYKSE